MQALEYKELATQIRILSLKGLQKVGAGHIGGIMSMIDLMAVLYGDVMNVDVKNPRWEERDWLVVSKGHCGPAVYAALAKKGFFDEDVMLTVNQPGTTLPSHCDRNKTIGIDMSTGSLGQGMSTAIGVAWGNRYFDRKSFTYLVIGDGESQEGQIWEGALFAAQHKLSNLIAFLDCNEKQLDGYTSDICGLGDVGQKFRDFGWNVLECDGHDHLQIVNAIRLAQHSATKPSMIVLKTEKGKGCSFSEGVLYNHHMAVSQDEFNKAIQLLEQELHEVQSAMQERGEQNV